MELLFSLFFFTSSTIWVPVAVFHSLRFSKSISYLKITPWFSSPLANQKSQRSYSSRRLFFPAEGFPSIYTAVLRTLINGGKRKKYCSQYPLENSPEFSRLVFRTQLRFVSKMTDAFALVTHRYWDYSHSSFPNVQYIPNHSKY